MIHFVLLFLFLTFFIFVAVDLKSIRENLETKPKKVKTGLLSPNANVQFIKGENSSVNLVGSAVG